jgi:hypothetical protein
MFLLRMSDVDITWCSAAFSDHGLQDRASNLGREVQVLDIKANAGDSEA